MIPVIEALYGLPTVLGALTLIAITGTVLTLLTIKETKNRSLEETSLAIKPPSSSLNPGSKL